MSRTKNANSRIDGNKLAVTIVAGSVFVLTLVFLLYWIGILEYIVPDHGPAADAVPLYFLLAVTAVLLAVWGWLRFFSFFR
ncbi:hypothetical protein [Natrarchaeobius chitinivorans]|uniref:Uncharacterized protein n=1 Tax=Natrarchaeobius chitinivorans TaxID=1679083 RepID=A0A3N6LNH8_NATCH|nr:hypothetical protein [Natrarchaeobius chitinivorans]RQG90943.1 hypothetical protein EA473_19345 [Natrarchaeobius chitinivorans]